MVKKFRAWSKATKEMVTVTVENIGYILSHRENYVVMQYTGKHDCHGLEIFEGDVVGSYISTNSVVTYDEISACYFLNYGDPLAPMEDMAMPDECFEVLGNVWENPELMEVHA